MSRLAWVALLALALALAAWQWLGANPRAENPSPAAGETQPPLGAASTAGGGVPPAARERVVASDPSAFEQALLRTPEEVQQALVALRERLDPQDWAHQPVQPNLARWRRAAEQTPESAASLARALQRCARPRFSSLREVEQQWQSELAMLAGRDLSPERYAEQRGWQAQRLAVGLADLADCQGLARDEARREYLRWLERAARELPPSEARVRLRLSYIEDPFLDLPRSADRIGAIDEVIRRRDIARAWLHELREEGQWLAFDLSQTAYSAWGELEAMDIAEGIAWGFVQEIAGAVRAAGVDPSREGLARAAELWATAPSRTRPEDAAYLEEGRRRGQEHYLRIFGAPPG